MGTLAVYCHNTYHHTFKRWKKPWMDPQIIQFHRLAMHVDTLRILVDEESARRVACGEGGGPCSVATAHRISNVSRKSNHPSHTSRRSNCVSSDDDDDNEEEDDELLEETGDIEKDTVSTTTTTSQDNHEYPPTAQEDDRGEDKEGEENDKGEPHDKDIHGHVHSISYPRYEEEDDHRNPLNHDDLAPNVWNINSLPWKFRFFMTVEDGLMLVQNDDPEENYDSLTDVQQDLHPRI